MASAADIAALMIAGMAPPAGSADIGFHQGVIESWDELSGVNQVTVNGTTLTNLKTIQSGIGVQYQHGDVVAVFRYQSTYFVWGRIAAPGGIAANQIVTDITEAAETPPTSLGDMATFGPQVTANIGSSRRALVMMSAQIALLSPDLNNNQYAVGRMALQVTGASNIPASSGYELGSSLIGAGATFFPSRSFLLTEADGLHSGQNTFTAKYKRDNDLSTVIASRVITVIPF